MIRVSDLIIFNIILVNTSGVCKLYSTKNFNMSSQRSGCEKRKRKACKEAELLKIKSKCSIKNYFTSSTSNFQSSSAENTTDSISDSTKKIENKELHSDDASADNTTDSIFESSKKSENKELYSDDVNMVNVYDPVNPFSKDRLEFQNRILKGRYKPILDLYPRSLQNSKKRSFQKNWYDIFDWLEYSDASDKAFCFPCRCFKGNEINSSYSESTFSSNGFKAWYRAIDAFKKHQSSKCHLNSAKALTYFINLKSIDCVLDKNRLEEISRKEKDRLKNREFMNRIIDIIICLGKSGRPFRGHDEKSDSCNQGLFKELVILLTKYDVVLQDHLQEAPKNALYTSNRIQNDLITSIKNVILRNIKNNLQNSFISIMADETTDVGHFEQLSIVFRYFDEKKNRPVETYITLKRMQSVTAQAIFDCLHDVLILMGKDWHSVLSVCFDGASTMAGKIGGVQTKCKEQNSNIKYIHCYAHCLNLALVDSVAQDETGNSKGYGFVHFETKQSATQSIEKVNGMLLNGKKVFVGRFVGRNDREKELGQQAKLYTNVYIKNIDENVNEKELFEMFKKYGTITSCKVMFKDDGSSRGFGFVAFEDPKEAEKAVTELHGKKSPEGKTYYVNRAQKKTERQQELKRKFEQYKIERINRYQGVNLYVKNLDDTIDDERLRREFSAFGTIKSAKVMMDDGRSKGFGFVYFSSPEEATKAVTDMNGRIVGTKPLYVTLAQRKKDRKAHLDSQYSQRNTNMRMQSIGPIYQPGASNGYFVPTIPQPQYFYGPTQMTQIRSQPRWAFQSQVRAGTPQTAAPGYPNMATQHQNIGARAPVPAGQQAALARNVMVDTNARPISTAQQKMPGAVSAGSVHVPGARDTGSGYKYTPNMRNPLSQDQGIGQAQPGQAQGMGQSQPGQAQGMGQAQSGQAQGMEQVQPDKAAVHVYGQEPLTATMLATAKPEDQKQMLGERLFPLIERMYPELTGKITGMLLEIDNSDLLHMLEHHESLKNQVEKAVAMLQAHQAQ
eukprot:XP_016661326.1 PREDICTED: polyadenylate-binding protein-like [Acyrthosiphon pisum]